MMEPVDLDLLNTSPAPEKEWAACGHGGKRKKNIINSLYLQPEQLEQTVIERFKRYDVIKENETRFEEYMTEDADILIVAYGITARIAKSAVMMARAKGIKAGLFRPITLWPYPDKALAAAAEKVNKLLVCELNMGQMVDDVKVAINCSKPVEFFGRTGGMMPTPEDILAQLKKM